MKKKWERGNLILVTIFRLIGIMTLLVMSASAQTAILECAGSSEKGGRVTLTFRTGLVEKMAVTRATLLVHLRQAVPAPVRVKVNGRAAAATKLDQGWISVAVPGKDALKPLVVEGALFDGPAAPGFSPYLAVEGVQRRE